MNLLRAKAKTYDANGWWEIQLEDLYIAAGGANEEAMLSNLEYKIIAEYEIALSDNRIPFIDLRRQSNLPTPSVSEGPAFRRLNLPDPVRLALSNFFEADRVLEFAPANTMRAA